jgi:tetratricopeptide (TPR) repeat protein
MENLTGSKLKEQQAQEAVDIVPSGESMLAELGLNQTTLKFIKPRWKRTHYRAVINWLTKYQPYPDAPMRNNLEKGRGYLEAFYHLYKAEDWEKARKIIGVCFNTPTNETSLVQLRSWGFYKLEQYSEALAYLEAALKISRSTGDRLTEAITLYDLAIVHQIGSVQLALEYCEQALVIAKELRIPLEKYCLKLKIILLDSEANIYMSKGNQLKAIEFCKQRLVLAKELQDQRGEERTLITLGKAYCALGEYKEAIAYNQQHLALVQVTLQQLQRSHPD